MREREIDSQYLNRNPLDDIAADVPLPSVIKFCHTAVTVAQKMLDVFQRRAMQEQVGRRAGAKGMRRRGTFDASRFKSPLDHAADVDRRNAARRQPATAAIGRSKQRLFLAKLGEARRLPILLDVRLQIGANRNGSGLSPLLGEAKDELRTLARKVLKTQFRDRADPRRRIDEDRDQGPVPVVHDGVGANRCQQRAALLDGDLRRLTFERRVARRANAVGWIEDENMPLNQGIQEGADCRQVQLLGRGAER